MKRITAFILTLALCVSMLCGCTKTSDKNESTADKSIESVYYDTHSENRLSNPNATKEAIAVYNYIWEVYENKILSGQQESTWKDSDEYEMDFLFDNTGKLPAIRGLDFMNNDFYSSVDRAEDWWKKGGIVTICWHCGTDFCDSWD